MDKLSIVLLPTIAKKFAMQYFMLIEHLHYDKNHKGDFLNCGKHGCMDNKRILSDFQSWLE